MSDLAPCSPNKFSILATTVPEIDTNSEQLHIPVKLKGRNREKEIAAMVDSGASTLFLSKEFVRKNHVRTTRLTHAIPLYNIDGTHNKMGDITHVAELGLQIGDHVEKQVIFTVACSQVMTVSALAFAFCFYLLPSSGQPLSGATI